MKTLKFAGRYVLRHWWQYLLGILALYLVDQVNVYVPEYTGNIIDGLTEQTLTLEGGLGLRP